MTQHVQLPSGRVIDLDRVASINEHKCRAGGVDVTSLVVNIAGIRNEHGESLLLLYGTDTAAVADAEVIREWMATLPKLTDLVRGPK